MSKMVKEFEYILNEAIEIHKGGSIASSTNLLLKAPTNQHKFYLTKLKQGFIRACLSMPTNKNKSVVSIKDESVEAQFDATAILMALLASDIDFNEYMEVFKQLICSNLGFVEGNIAITPHVFDQISLEDQEQLLGKYIESFLLFSWMNLLGIK